jgi:phosphoglycolate phosphatase-like HAD superfamily hydrolase
MSKIDYILSHKLIIFDFDGVIKQSNKAKLDGYLNLINDVDANSLKYIKNHHINNQGISRFDKIPMYLNHYYKNIKDIDIDHYLKKYSNLVVDEVVNSAWVDGVLDLIKSKKQDNIFAICTGTPQDEIKKIIDDLRIGHFFDYVYGSPMKKITATGMILESTNFMNTESLFIGDAREDFIAATEYDLNFLLVRNKYNEIFSKTYKGNECNDFLS